MGEAPARPLVGRYVRPIGSLSANGCCSCTAERNRPARAGVYGPMNKTAWLFAALLLVVAACTSAGGPSPSDTPTPTPPITVTTPEQAARLVLATDSRFRNIKPFDPNLIGQAAWYQAKAAGDRFEVVVRIGWGDCPAGCIDEHRWTYQVARNGVVGLVGETGPAVPAGVIDSIGGNPGGGELGVSGRATAGPTCPVMQSPPDPACADRPVAGAVLVVTDDGGREVARATTDATGDFSIPLEPGHYVLTPQPVEGLMGTASPVDFTVPTGGPPITFDVAYDTGIR